MRKKKNTREERPALKRHAAFSLTGGFAVWVILLLIAILATQLLRSSASDLFFWFVFLLPWLSLAHVLLAKRALRAYLPEASLTVEKNAPATYEFRVYNESILPYPFTEAYLMLPRNDAVRCTEVRTKLSVPPLSDYTVRQEVRFRFRGTYRIGVSCFYAYDLFRMFRIRIPVECYEDVYVLPRKLMENVPPQMKSSDSTKQTRRNRNSYEKLEVSDIRDYVPGDPIKSIHWKLSSKSEALIVREYNTGTADLTCIYVDLSDHFPKIAPEKTFSDFAAVPAMPDGEEKTPEDVNALLSDDFYEDMNEYCADGVVELTVAAVHRELTAGRRVRLVWYDSRSDIGIFCFDLQTLADFASVFKLFGTAPASPAGKQVTGLCAMSDGDEETKTIFLLPTLDNPTVAALCAMPQASGNTEAGENTVTVFAAEERYASPAARAAYLEECATRLGGAGYALTKGSLEGYYAMPEPSEKHRKEEPVHA